MILSAANEAEFIPYMQQMKDYLRARKELPSLNPDQLVDTLKIGLETLLLLNGQSGVLIRVGSEWYETSFSGHDSQGNPIRISVPDFIYYLIRNIASDLLKKSNPIAFQRLLEIIAAAIENQAIDLTYKLEIISAELDTLQVVYAHYLSQMSEVEIISQINLRKEFIVGLINNPILFANEAAISVDNLYEIYRLYIRLLRRTFIHKGRLTDVFNYLYRELDFVANPFIASKIAWELVRFNNLFLIENPETLKNKLNQKNHLFNKQDLESIIQAIKFDISEIPEGALSIGFGPAEILANLADEVTTKISFVIPRRIETAKTIILGDGTKIQFTHLNNHYDDPIFNFIDREELTLEDIPLSIVSEAYLDRQNKTLATILLNEFYHPDFEISDNDLVSNKFEEEKALTGREYFPHKQRIIKILREAQLELGSQFPIVMERADLNIELFSNYFVNYLDRTGSPVFHMIYIHTSTESSPKLKRRYLETLGDLGHEQSTKVRELLFKSEINSDQSLCDFVFQIMKMTVKHAIEFRGLDKKLWKSANPEKETDAQPLVYSLMELPLEAKGVNISREVVSANGCLDFYCSYTKNDIPSRVCIEMKNAHHAKLLHGLQEQLPQYMKSEKTRSGIFLVLWYKGKNYSAPQKFNTLDELKLHLEANVPPGFNIKIMIIDCSEKTVPSKL